MVMHIRSLDNDTLASQIYEEQKANKWSGLAKETKDICSKLRVEDCNSTNLSKVSYRRIFLEACKREHEAKMREDGKDKTKCKRILNDASLLLPAMRKVVKYFETYIPE